MGPKLLSVEAQHVVAEINPWWGSPHVVRPVPPDYERHQVGRIIAALVRPGARVQVLRGPRQVGKSTAMLQTVRNLIRKGVPPKSILFVRFDLDILRESQSLLVVLRWYEQAVLGRRLADAPVYLLLDEVHKLPDWDEQVKHVFDTYRPRMVLTGSSSVLVARGQRESLAGRALTLELPPFTFREVLELTAAAKASQLPARLSFRSVFEDPDGALAVLRSMRRQPPQRQHSWRRDLDRYYNRGGYPDLHTGAVEEDRWADYLIETVFERVLGVDIPDLFPVDQPRLLRHVYMEVARRTGQEISQKRVADEANAAGYSTNQPTVGRYLHYLTDALLIREFRRYPLTKKASAKVPVKCTLTDLGIRNAIFRGAPSLWESAPDVVGPLVETMVQTVMHGVGLQVHFYRDLRDGAKPRGGYDEVDYVAEDAGGRLFPIEVKFRNRIDREDLDGVRRFMRRYGCRHGLVVTRETSGLEDGVALVPLMDFLLAF